MATVHGTTTDKPEERVVLRGDKPVIHRPDADKSLVEKLATDKTPLITPTPLAVPAPPLMPAPIESNADAPSQFKNNMDQISQPARHGAAGGQVPPIGAAGNEMAPTDIATVSVTLNNTYAPLTDQFFIVGPPGATMPANKKLASGTRVRLPVNEAEDLVRTGRASRDPA